MSCVLVPAAEAIIVTAVNKLTAGKNKESGNTKVVELGAPAKISFHEKVKWLQNMLWGGSALLAFEHVWHGEMEPWFPFLTAAKNPADLAEMFHEMATAGVGMAVLVTAVWGMMLAGARVIENRALTARNTVK